MSRINLTELPDEVIQGILTYGLPDAALSLEKTSRRFRDVSNEPQLWKLYCLSLFRNWAGDHGLCYRLPSPAVEDWKQLYASRAASSRSAGQALNLVIRESLGRIDRIASIVDHGLDVKDDLLDAFEQAPASEYHLAQKYWAHVVLGCLHRSLAIEQWARLKYRNDSADSFELALGAFDLFILHERSDGDIADIFSRLNAYALEIRTSHPEIDSLSPRSKAILIANHLLEKSYVGISAKNHYHSLDHMFLGVGLYSPLRNSLPLISAAIYCAVARRLNLRAAPCSFPFHVHAIVQAPDGFDLDGNLLPTDPATSQTRSSLVEATTFYLDPFHNAEPISASTLTSELEFIARRRGAAFTESQASTFLSPATPRDITIRAAINIQNSPQNAPPPPTFPVSATSAAYSASWALTLLPSHVPQLRQSIALLFNQFVSLDPAFTYDLPLIESHILPLTAHLPQSEQYHNYIRSLRTDDVTPKVPKRHLSDPDNRAVKYRVGQVFRHRMRGYLACVTGWDARCEMPDEWVIMNQVGRLERGRGQPFYNVIVEDTTTRYVAEDNVMVLPLSESAELDIETIFPIDIGRHFKRWDKERGVFVSNVRDEYPED